MTGEGVGADCKVASRVVCKSGERVTGPLLVHTVKDAKEYSFTAVTGGKGAHGADTAADFYEEAFDDIGGAQSFPVSLGAIKEGQEFFEIPFQAGHSLGGLSLPSPLPLPEQLDCFSPVRSLINEFGLVQARLLGSFEFVLQVAQLVCPAALMGHGRPESANRLGQSDLPIGANEFQELSM